MGRMRRQAGEEDLLDPRMIQARLPKLGPYSSILGNLPLVQSNVPESTMTPPMLVPWPPIHLVAEWTTMSAPCSIGRQR